MTRAMRTASNSLRAPRRTTLSTDEGPALETVTSAVSFMIPYSCSLRAGCRAFESRTPALLSFASWAREARTPATTRGPSTEPRPASSTPQIRTSVPWFNNIKRLTGIAVDSQITEGRTQLLVPSASLGAGPPPSEPAFFNPRAKFNRDVSVAAYAAMLKRLRGPPDMLDCMAGIGARGLRAANEAGVEVTLNDRNPAARDLAVRSARLNGLDVDVLDRDACVLCSERSGAGVRAGIVDLDPFGTPAPFIDCALRAVRHGGMLSLTATDLRVLNGPFRAACRRRYGGVSLRVRYGRELGLRLLIGCVRGVAARLGLGVTPFAAESDLHYYRAYLLVRRRPDTADNIGYIAHCYSCGHRAVSGSCDPCAACGQSVNLAGPLWTGRLFDGPFIGDMRAAAPEGCERLLDEAVTEAGLPACYHTVDEVSARTGRQPASPDRAVKTLRSAGFAASRTSFDPTGFRTDAPAPEIDRLL